MTIDPHTEDRIWRQVGDEVAREEYASGPMAKAVAQADGNKDRVNSLYRQFRFEELWRELEREAADGKERERARAEEQALERELSEIRAGEERRRAWEERQIAEKKAKWGETSEHMSCPTCRYQGTMVRRAEMCHPAVAMVVCIAGWCVGAVILGFMPGFSEAQAIAFFFVLCGGPLLAVVLRCTRVTHAAICPSCCAVVKKRV